MTPTFGRADEALADLVLATTDGVGTSAAVAAWPVDALPSGRLVGISVPDADDLVVQGALVVDGEVLRAQAALAHLWSTWVGSGRAIDDPVLVAASGHLLAAGRHTAVITDDDVAALSGVGAHAGLVERPVALSVSGHLGVRFWWRERYSVARLSLVWTGVDVVCQAEQLADVAAGAEPRVALEHLVAFSLADLDDPDSIPDEVADALLPDG